MVWWYITVWPQNIIWTNVKVSYTIHKLWSSIVGPKLTKFITNSKLLKIFWNLHLYLLCVKYCPWKIINVNKQSLSTNPLTLKVEGTMWSSRSCPSTPISYLWTINSPGIVQMTSNLAQGCIVTCQIKWYFHDAVPIWFEIFKKFMQKLKFSVPFVKHRPKSILASSKSHDGMMMVHHIVTRKHHLDQPKSLRHGFGCTI